MEGGAVTDHEWERCTDPGPMLAFLGDGHATSARKQRLCAVAWARALLRHAAEVPATQPLRDWLAAPPWLPQLEMAERYADGQADRQALRAARRETGGPYNLYLVVAGVAHFSFEAAGRAVRSVQHEFGVPPDREVCDLTRCLFGNPLRPPPDILPSVLAWQDGTVVKLAQAIYDDRAFERMPVLADALEEAGCSDPQLLGHLRGPGPHVRGCWVVDVILGRA
jgi:hypothetical protein